jgi:RNA polymerase-binding transcription factor
VKSAPVKSAPVKSAPVKSAAKKSAPAKQAAPVKAAAKTSAPAKKSAAKKSAPATKAPAKAAATKARAAKTPTKQTSPSTLAVREGERPWTAKEIAEVRATLVNDQQRLEEEIAAAEEEIGHLLREGGEGAGHDQADVGSNTFERDHEMSMARNARDNLVLVKEAIARVDDGSYGVCESCGNPIGKMRLEAFPRATLCMECKQRQERR